MTDLTPEAVRMLGATLGLPVTPEDAVEVAHRLNAFLEALAAVEELPLDSVEPVPMRVPVAVGEVGP